LVLVSAHKYAISKGADVQAMRRALKNVGLIGRFDPVEADKRLAEARMARFTNKDQKPSEDSYAEADRRQKWAKAKQEELKLQKIEGTLVLRSVVKTQVFDMIRRARDKMENIPARISGVLAVESDQARIFAYLSHEIHQALEDLAS
jgi:regulator of PEP synthase PpsR (kinase-PPPase family)